MSMQLVKFTFNPAAPTEGQRVGSFLLGAGEAVITSTSISGKEALDVNVLSTSDDGIFAEDAAHTDEDNGQHILGVRQDADTSPVSADGDYHSFIFGANGALKVELKPSVADDAADSGNPVKIGYRAVSGALAALSASGDRANAISDLYRRQFINEAPNVGWKVNSVGVTNTAAEVGATPQAGRKKVLIENLSSVSVYIGPDNTVSTVNGFEIPKDSSMELPFGEDLDLWVIAPSAGPHAIKVLEIG